MSLSVADLLEPRRPHRGPRRTTDLLDAIEDHANSGQDFDSEANQVIQNFIA